MRQKVREGKHQHISHHGLIKIIVMDALSHLKNPVLWAEFLEMDREAFIETQALTSTQQEETPTSSIWCREENTEEEEKEKIEEEDEEEGEK